MRGAGLRQEGFLKRLIRTTVIVSVYVTLFLLGLGRVREGVSYAIGAMVSLAMLWSTIQVVQAVIRPGAKRRRWFTGAIAVTKYGIAGVVVWAVVRWDFSSVPWFVVGATTVQAVLVLKAVGTLVAENVEPLPGRTNRDGAADKQE